MSRNLDPCGFCGQVMCDHVVCPNCNGGGSVRLPDDCGVCRGEGVVSESKPESEG